MKVLNISPLWSFILHCSLFKDLLSVKDLGLPEIEEKFLKPIISSFGLIVSKSSGSWNTYMGLYIQLTLINQRERQFYKLRLSLMSDGTKS